MQERKTFYKGKNVNYYVKTKDNRQYKTNAQISKQKMKEKLMRSITPSNDLEQKKFMYTNFKSKKFKRNGSKKGYRKINFAQIKKKDRITRKHKEKCAN